MRKNLRAVSRTRSWSEVKMRRVLVSVSMAAMDGSGRAAVTEATLRRCSNNDGRHLHQRTRED